MATVSSASPWPSDSTSALDSNCTVPSHHRDRGDETEPLDSFSSMTLTSEDVNRNSDQILDTNLDGNIKRLFIHIPRVHWRRLLHRCSGSPTTKTHLLLCRHDHGFQILNCVPFN